VRRKRRKKKRILQGVRRRRKRVTRRRLKGRKNSRNTRPEESVTSRLAMLERLLGFLIG
jgi:hypothetical protein